MSTPKPDSFMQYFEHLLVYLYDLDVFICARNLDEYFTKSIPGKCLNFLCLVFESIDAKSSK